nr:hypothetical protein [uncultured Chitinophaga sp.]
MKKSMIFLLFAGILLTNACSKTMDTDPKLPDDARSKAPESISQPLSFVTNPTNLNIVMFVPKDNPALPDYKTRLSALMVHFQKWFHTEMLRYGYDKYMGLPRDSNGLVKIIEIQAQGGQADYPASATTKILAEIDAYKASHPSEFSNATHILILSPQRTDSVNVSQPFVGNKDKNYCFATDNANVAVDKIPNPSANWVGGMLHELGHGLKLAHNHAKEVAEKSLGTSLMGAGNISFSKGTPTFLTLVDAAILNRNIVFQNEVPAEPPYEKGTTTINVKLSYDSSSQQINILGNFTSDKPVSDILVYLDADNRNPQKTDEIQIGQNKDYDAVAWRFDPGADNTITGAMPLEELKYKTNERYQATVKLLLKNGAVITKSIDFSFLNGVPQFEN